MQHLALTQGNPMLTLPKRWRYPLQARSAIAGQLRTRYFLRVHAFLLFAWTFGLSWLVAKFLFFVGHGTLWQRYAITCVAGYLLFLLGMRIWLSYVGAVRDSFDQIDGDLQLPSGSGDSSPSFSGGGGSFDGGGASDNFDVADGMLDKAGESGGKLLDGVVWQIHGKALSSGTERQAIAASHIESRRVPEKTVSVCQPCKAPNSILPSPKH